MRRIALVVSLMLVAAACASGTQTGAADATATNPTTTAPVPAGDTSAQDESVDLFPRPEGPLAPDFTMTLASGETFTLSNAQKPVYMIFWAEW